MRPLAIALVLLPALLMLTVAPAGSAFAHPLGNFTINRYARLELYQDRVRLHYVLDFAEIPSFQLLTEVDTDGDEQASQQELDAYTVAQRELWGAAITLSVDGKRLALRPIGHTAQVLPGQAGLTTTRIAVVYDVIVTGVAKDSAVTYADGNFEGRAGWKEIVVKPSEGARATVAPELLVDLSDALRAYPEDTLSASPSLSEAAFSWTPGTGEVAPAVAGAEPGAKGRGGSGFTGLFEDALSGDQSLAFILLSLLIAFVFGAQHALGPGHGKTMVGAYLVGSKGTPRQALMLGLTVTATHTSTVYLLGLVTLVAANYVAPDKVYLWMGVVSGAMVVVFGASLFASRLLTLGRRREESSSHRHGLFGRSHSHTPAPIEPQHEHGEAHDHDHPHEQAEARVTTRSLLSLGILGGLLPCPSAVVVMVAAIAQGEVALGMLLIVAFSLGLAGVLSAIGLSLVLGKRLPGRHRRVLGHPIVRRGLVYMPVFSAFVVMAAGLGITYQALQQPGF